MSKATTRSVGLEGARIIGDQKVSSLMQFSWSARHDSTATGKSAIGAGNRNPQHGQSSVSKPRSQPKGRGSK